MPFVVRPVLACRLVTRTMFFRTVSILLAGVALVTNVAAAAEITDAVTLFRTGHYEECIAACADVIGRDEYGESWRVLKLQSEMALGRYPEALATLEQALPKYTTSVRLRWLGAEACRFNGNVERAKTLLEEIDQLVLGGVSRFVDPASRVTLGRFYLFRGIDAKQVLDATWNAVKKQQPNFAEAYLAAGQLALDKHDYALAAEELKKALQYDATDPDILFGLASAFNESDSDKATEHLRAALERNPRHVDSLLLTIDSHIDAERYAEARELIDRVLGVNMLEPRAWAFRAVMAHVQGDEREEAVCRNMALAWWPTNPEVDYLLGHELSQKYRFREGAAHQRQSLAFDPHYLPAKVQLSQDLLRLGEEADGWRLAQEVFDTDGYNVVAHNLTRLRDHLGTFRSLEGDGFVVRMESQEASIYGNRVLELLKRAKATLTAKYEVELPKPILVEIFPEQQDFAIRTFGLPGGDGFLGVCFGSVITANSSATRTDHAVNWESVLWHEFCHVVTLHKTHNKMPRWLSEGISVYEERQANPTWGQSMSSAYRIMILGEELTPVSKLSGAFLHAPSPAHLQFAYYESSLVVEFLIERYGLEALKRILTDLGVGMPINDALQRSTGSLAALDQEFAEFARKRANAFSPTADWTSSGLPLTAETDAFREFVKGHPENYEGLNRLAQLLVSEEKWEEAKAPLRKLLELNPHDELSLASLAQVHRRLGEAAEEQDILERWANASSDAAPAYLRLLEIHSAKQDWVGVERSAERMIAVSPLLVAPYRALSRAAEATGNDAKAMGALKTTLSLAPVDAVDLRYRLAGLLQKHGQLQEAKRQVLMALEDAPRFRAGHQRLLEIVRELEKHGGKQPTPAETPAPGALP